MKDETLSIAYIDAGYVNGSFTYSLADALINLLGEIPITNIQRSSSSLIIMNRRSVLETFLLKTTADWLLCIDSDISFKPDDIRKLWNHRGSDKQVISGVYFIITEATETIPVVVPCIYSVAPDEPLAGASPIHPLPENSFMKVDKAGFGFLMMSRLVVEKVLDNNANPFVGRVNKDGELVGEDFAFFEKLAELGIDAYADTSILLSHEKEFFLHKNYYDFVWKRIQDKTI